MKPEQLFDDLKASLDELRGHHPKFTDDELFLAWFLRAYVTDSDECAANAVVGESRDKGVDGLLIDDTARAVFVVQAKYRQKLEANAEGRNDVMAFADVAVSLNDPDDASFQKFLDDASELVGSRLRDAQEDHEGQIPPLALLRDYRAGKPLHSQRCSATRSEDQSPVTH